MKAPKEAFNGEYSPGLELLLRISQFFELPVEEIFTYEPL